MGYIARHETNAVHRKRDGMIVGPEHEEEWAEYQEWLKAGNKPDDPEPLPEPPSEPTVHEKLAGAGLTIDELKEALGLK